MIKIEQTEFYEDEKRHGNCQAACIASIFEIPISQAEGATHYREGIQGWIRKNYPALGAKEEILAPSRGMELEYLEDIHGWPAIGDVWREGYWIAGVKSFRIPAEEIYGCGCGGKKRCKWCHGKPNERYHGVKWGIHAVVMFMQNLVWDPHPHRDDGVGPIYVATTFHVRDPSKL